MKNIKKYAIIAIFLAILISPNVSSADTIADLQAQISALLAQIQNLQQQLAQLQGQPATWCHDFNTNLTIGSSGSEVEALRTALEKEGFKIGSGNFDESMASLVSGFQQKYKDEVLAPWNLQYGTGFAGSTTRAKLNKLYGCGITPPSICKIAMITCAPGYRSVCPTGLDAQGCPLPCGCVLITTNQPPVISGISGPTTLNVGQTGTWTITASDPEQGTLTYSVFWGDEIVGYSATNPFKPQEYTQTATFTHVYSKAGVYTPTFTVTDNGGLSAKTSISVNVGAIITTSSITVLSPNGGEVWIKGTMQTIKWRDNTPPPLCPVGAFCMPAAPKYYDITLVQYYPPCTGEVCSMIYPYPYTIAKNIQGSSYNWSVGKYLQEVYATGGIAPDGSYTIQICQTGSTICDSSDSYFSIAAATASQSSQLNQMASALESAKYILYQLLDLIKGL